MQRWDVAFVVVRSFVFARRNEMRVYVYARLCENVRAQGDVYLLGRLEQPVQRRIAAVECPRK